MDTTMPVLKGVMRMESSRDRNVCKESKHKKQIRISAGYKDCQVVKKYLTEKETMKPLVSTPTIRFSGHIRQGPEGV